MVKIISFASFRGGAGRSVLTAMTGKILSRKNKVLLIDASFGDLSKLMNIDEKFEGCLMQGIADDTFTSSIYKINANLSIIPHHIDTDLDAIHLNSNTSDIKSFQKFTSLLLPIKEEYEYIVIDAPSRFGALMINAIIASDICFQLADLYTNKTENDSDDSIKTFLDVFNEIFQDTIFGGAIIATQGSPQKIIDTYLPQIRHKYSDLVLKNVIEKTKIGKINAAIQGKEEIKVYNNIVDEIITKLK